jgi:ABC-type polar amino acid transport system ATPase subunit
MTAITITKTTTMLILGMGGSGKSYLASLLAKVYEKVGIGYIALDPTGALKNTYNMKRAIVIDSYNDEAVNKALKFAFKRKLNVIVDEIDSFKYGKSTYLRHLIMRARNWNIGWIAIARQTSKVDKTIIANADYSFIFANYELNAVQYLTHNYLVTGSELAKLKKEDHTYYIAKASEILRDKSGNPIIFKGLNFENA